MVAKAIRLAADKPTVLLIDDFHMVSPHLQAYFYGLLLERRLGNYKLSDNIAIVLTMNNSESAGFSGINSAVRNRMAILEIEFNFDYWFENYGKRLHYLVASFLKSKPHNCMEEETTGVIGYATARAWSAIAAELSYYSESEISQLGYKLAGMQVSKEVSRAFQTHIAYIAAIDFTNTVKSRELVDLSKREPIDSTIYSYIVNFINTLDDGIYLMNLLETNIEQSTFVGFVLGEVYTRYIDNSIKLTDGIQFIIDTIMSNPKLSANYANTSQVSLDKTSNLKFEHLPILMDRAQEYLI